jgi:phosphoribosylamine-glycine ligase
LIDVPEQAGKHLSLGDSKLGVLGVATAKGTDVREARRRVYRTVQNAVTSRVVQYRDDIGVIQEKDLQTLKEWGWL